MTWQRDKTLLNARSAPSRRLQSGCSLPVHCNKFWIKSRKSKEFSFQFNQIKPFWSTFFSNTYYIIGIIASFVCPLQEMGFSEAELLARLDDSPECGSGSRGCETQAPAAGRAASFPPSPSGRSVKSRWRMSTKRVWFLEYITTEWWRFSLRNTCTLWLFSGWFSLLNSSERKDARVVVYPRYISEKAVCPNQSELSELPPCSVSRSEVICKKKSTDLHHFGRSAAPGCLQPEISSVRPKVAPAGCFWRADVAAAAAPQTSDTSDWMKEKEKHRMLLLFFCFCLAWPHFVFVLPC